MTAGTNCAWQVLYKNVNVLEIVDMSTWSLQPHVTVMLETGSEDTQEPVSEEPVSEELSSEDSSSEETEPEEPKVIDQIIEVQELDTTPLTGLVNTQATLSGMVKKAYKESGVSAETQGKKANVQGRNVTLTAKGIGVNTNIVTEIKADELTGGSNTAIANLKQLANADATDVTM